MRILYDMTRLLKRFRGRRPTGVDRVDLNYVRWLREHAKGFVGVVQTEVGFRLLSATELDAIWGGEGLKAERLEGLKGEGGKRADLRSGRFAEWQSCRVVKV